MKRLIAILVATVLLLACIPAMAESTPPEIRLAQASIEAMSYTVQNLTDIVGILARLMEENTMTATKFADRTLSNFGKQITDLYNKLEYDAYLKEIEAQMQAFDQKNTIAAILEQMAAQQEYKDIYDAITGPQMDENGNEVINDLAKEFADAFNQFTTDAEGITEEESANTLNDFLNEILKNEDKSEDGTLPPKPDQNPLVGGWTILTDPTITDPMLNMVTTATAEMSDVAIEPLACIGTQLVAGENFCYFCKLDHQGEPGDEYTQYILLYVYVDLNGNAEVIGWVPLNPGILAGMTE